jgi:hypothetical protein
VIEVRTHTMTSPLLSARGMFHGADVLEVEHLLGHAVVDAGGRILVPVVDVLAILRIDVDAELLVVHSRDRASRALRLSDVVGCDEVFLQLQLDEGSDGGDASWAALLWSQRSGSSSPVESLQATSFASFVGLT